MRRGGSIYDHPQYVEQYVAAVRPDVLCLDRYPSFGFQMSPPPETVMRPINDTCTHSTKPAPVPTSKENNRRQQSAAVQTMSRASSETLATATYTR